MPDPVQLQQFIRLDTDRENPRDDDSMAIRANSVLWPLEWPPPKKVYAVVAFDGTKPPAIFTDAMMAELAGTLALLGEQMIDHYVVYHYEQVRCSKWPDDAVQPGSALARGAEYHFRGVSPWIRPEAAPTQESTDV